jgi:hypothetical protein
VPVRILGLSGHLHKYGVGLRFEDRTTGDVLWEAKPIVDSTGEIVGMPVTKFVWTLGKLIVPDHVYRLTATYENPTGHVIAQDGMGVMGGLVVLARGAQWPTVDKHDAEYQFDVQAITRAMSDMPGMQHASP